MKNGKLERLFLFLSAMIVCVTGFHVMFPIPIGLFFVFFPIRDDFTNGEIVALILLITAVGLSLASLAIGSTRVRGIVHLLSIACYAAMIFTAVRAFTFDDFRPVSMVTYLPFIWFASHAVYGVYKESRAKPTREHANASNTPGRDSPRQ